MSSSKIKLTILMPIYNGERFLKEAIDSILKQTFADFELLIINDGSTDRSREIVLGYSDNRICFLENEENIGLIKTLNKGILESKGKYIARMDADDVSREDRLTKQISFLEENPTYGIVGSWCSVINSLKKIEYHTSHESLKFALLNYCCFVHPSVMIRKSVLIENQLFFDERFKHSEDYELWTRLLLKTKGANIQDYLIEYREHDNQVSYIYRKQQLQQQFEIITNYLKRIDHNIPRKFFQLFNKELLKNLNNAYYLVLLDEFYKYCLVNQLFDKIILKQNLQSQFRVAFFQIQKVRFREYKMIVHSELYISLNLTYKQRFRFLLRLFSFS